MSCPGIVNAILWLLLVIFIAWPIAFFLCGIYVFLLPFCGCIVALRSIMDPLLNLVQLPKTWAENMVAMKPLC